MIHLIKWGLTNWMNSSSRSAQANQRIADSIDLSPQYVRTVSWVMKYGLLLSLVYFTSDAFAQTNTCGAAVMQLQNYAVQINTFANSEYYQGIPLRCGWAPACMQWWLGQLNSWYMQQDALVTAWYNQITMQCTQQRMPGTLRNRRQTDNEPGQLDQRKIEDLNVDDEDKTVRIRIPSTPKGYR